MILQTFVVLDFLNTKAPGEQTSTSETTTPTPVLPKVCMVSLILLVDNYFTIITNIFLAGSCARRPEGHPREVRGGHRLGHRLHSGDADPREWQSR